MWFEICFRHPVGKSVDLINHNSVIWKGFCQQKTPRSSWGLLGIALNDNMRRLFWTGSFRGENRLTERGVVVVGKWHRVEGCVKVLEQLL